jgi:hypothetical protein
MCNVRRQSREDRLTLIPVDDASGRLRLKLNPEG